VEMLSRGRRGRRVEMLSRGRRGRRVEMLPRVLPLLLLIIIGICRSDIHRIQRGNGARQLRVERRSGREEEAGLKDAVDGLSLASLGTGDGDQFLKGVGELFIVVATLLKQASVCGYAVEADIVGDFQRVDRGEDIDCLDIGVLGYYG